ncbi:hypothetical protein [Bacillus thuringiensis]|uniref:hypothetical protein n=1 Tax=Bacillus thuringiensis TaxID=1428 RepID=UPI0011A08EEF|nr:hypothetical protein [Bacillus thuringiensis]
MDYISYNQEKVKEQRYKANEIWKELKKEKRIFEKPLKNITGSTTAIEIKGIEELKSWIGKSESYTNDVCSKLCPSCIPLLVQMCELFYYGPWKTEPMWLGTSIKRVIAMIYKNQFNNVGGLSTSRIDIINALYAAMLEERLCHAEFVGSYTKPYFILDREWLHENDEKTRYYQEELAYMYSGRGKSHRTLRDSIDSWVYNPKRFLQSIDNILNGEEPSKQDLFKDSLFSKLPVPHSQGKKAFWETLRSLLHLSIAVIEQINDNKIPRDSVIFLPGNKTLNTQQFANIQFQIRADVYWKAKWLNNQLKTLPRISMQHILVHRPIVGFSTEQDLYVTSLGLIGDAINNFIETSIINYEGHGTPFDKFYQMTIADPFEMEVKDILRTRGFITGEVNKEKGKDPVSVFWEILFNGKKEKIELINKTGNILPGQIDVLAYHPELKLVVILECKTFKIPHTPAEMKGFKERFTKTNEESFQGKLQSKLEWLQNSQCSSDIKDIPKNMLETDIQSFIIVDRPIVDFNTESRARVIELEFLKEILSELRMFQTL